MFFDVGLKSTVNYSVFDHLTLKNHGICSGFCFSPRKNTVNNSNFAVFPCFSLFFELRWSAIHGYQILRVFFPTISTFGCFWAQWPTSLAVTSGREGVRTTSWEPSWLGNPSLNNALRASTPPLHFPLRPWIMPLLCEPNDAVRAVAVAKRREYIIYN